MKTELEYLQQRREIVKMDLADIENRITELRKSSTKDSSKKSLKATAYADLSVKISRKKIA